jgi:hypothetical protein
VTKKEILKCGNSPCSSCPYKRDTPPGIWAEHEYEKLPAYDGSTLEQFANGAMVYDYQSPQPLYGSGAEAAAVGLAGVAQPSREAKARVEKLLRKHKRLREPKGEGKRNAST